MQYPDSPCSGLDAESSELLVTDVTRWTREQSCVHPSRKWLDSIPNLYTSWTLGVNPSWSCHAMTVQLLNYHLLVDKQMLVGLYPKYKHLVSQSSGCWWLCQSLS